MPKFSKSSNDKLGTCREELQIVFRETVKIFDCTIIEGYRSPKRQIELFNAGRSKVKKGKHNKVPSSAIDVGPYVAGRGIPWPKIGSKTYVKDLALFYYFAGHVMDRAASMGIKLRWGGDWDRDNDLTDQTFDDLVHFEIL